MLIQSVTKIEEGRYKITSRPCPDCSTAVSLEIDGASLFLANQGAFVQKVLPNEPDSVRERFVSGYCAGCWSLIFADDGEEESED
jgi:hypothetical protein